MFFSSKFIFKSYGVVYIEYNYGTTHINDWKEAIPSKKKTTFYDINKVGLKLNQYAL